MERIGPPEPVPYEIIPQSVPHRISASEEAYLIFVDAVLSEECALYQLSQSLFVGNGWNTRKSEAVGWCHIQRTIVGSEGSVICMCPDFKNTDRCFHQRFLTGYGRHAFPFECEMNDVSNLTFLFSRVEDSLFGDTFTNHFSVVNHSGYNNVKNRVVVEHHGDNNGGGTWTCPKEPSASSCEHILRARNTLQQLLTCDPSAKDPSASGEVFNGANSPRSVAGIISSVTYKALPPPLWARIKADPCHPKVSAVRSPPSLIRLDSLSSCACRREGSQYDSTRRVEERKCIIYNLLQAYQSITEVQKCPACVYGYIGPDATNLGLFNFNNRTMFTLAVLDDYTAHFTKSETPFVSWVASTACRYQNYESSISFVKEKLFRAAWFSYARLLQLDEDMCCSRCGPTPNVTIWDGVTLSFNRKNLLSSLQPPTASSNISETKSSIKPEVALQFLIDRTLRREIVAILDGPVLCLPKECQEPRPSQASQGVLEMMARIRLIPALIQKLGTVDSSLSAAFNCWFGTALLFSERPSQAVHQEFFLQLAAEESALQFLNGRGIQNLRQFLQHPRRNTISLLRLCPAIFKILSIDFEILGTISSETFEVLKWVYIRATLVLTRLKKYDYPQLVPELIGKDDWRTTGTCYGMPQIRKRPRYPGIPQDNATDLGGVDLRGEGCQKFYSTYGKNRMTGGLMCVWCPHSVCYGFHIIPQSEGRNDVFSAIYTRWKKAPEVIVYDFACALQPYCMLREPEFFSDTLFVIDAFHAKGHTKCGHASFLTNYLDTNPGLILVNSSAGESGNSGIRRIRKSVSYMSQDRAIIYTRVFLSIWNRQRIRGMESLM
ncbi:hypothetical protein CPB83DRAFT_761155 [Crepidotus variabilis]|uniref:HMG domain-containing protein n=1 Tax=Crepidotus variabilis TaxID=179855 RepID=A0A9P6EMH7_9AGAR|nr:hypothetical protein CPB83DRAFT_761155 [Crepidotus variabilis]